MSNVRQPTGLGHAAALEFLIRELGPQLLNIVLNTKRGQIHKWIVDPSLMNDAQKKLVNSLYDVVTILRTYLSVLETKLWLIDQSEYLFGIPVKEIRWRPEDVRMAALNRVSRGEDWEALKRFEEKGKYAKIEDSSEESNWG